MSKNPLRWELEEDIITSTCDMGLEDVIGVYMKGRKLELKKDYKGAYACYITDITNTGSPSVSSVAYFLWHGLGVEKNRDKAMEYYNIAAKHNKQIQEWINTLPK